MRRIGPRRLSRTMRVLTPLLAAALSAAATPLLTHADAVSGGAGGRVPEWFRDDGAAARRAPGGSPAAPVVADAGDASTPAAPTAPAAPAPAPAPAPVEAPAPANNGAAPAAPAQPVAPPAAPGNTHRPGAYTPAFQTNGAYGGSYGAQDFPSNQIYNVVVANARYATATALFRRAENDLSIAFRNADHRFESSPELHDATVAERDAYVQLNAARRRALQSLAGDERYTRLNALKDDMGEQISSRRARHELMLDELISMATLKMSYAVDIRAMEADALNAEPGVRDAQDKLVAAGSRVAALRARHRELLRDDPEILAARRNLDDARIARIGAEAYLRGAICASDVALNYSYWIHRSGYGLYNSDYGTGLGYGYGYGARY